MYLKYYNFRKEPFQITPDPEFLFLSPSHKEALASIIYGIEGKKGFIAIIGGVGVGKTTILRSYLDKVNKEQVKVIYIFNANLSFRSLLQTIYQELGVTPRTDEIFPMVNQLHEVLIDEYKKGSTVVLIVDEAQNIPLETLENLRMLSNLETATDKLIQIVLIGQPEFNDMLNLHELRQLKQRIAIRTTISPLTRAESKGYIEHRLSRVMLKKDEPVLTTGALDEITRYSRGIPRVINVICDNAFITGFGYQKKPVTAKIVREICVDFQSNRVKEQEARPEYFFRWKTAAVLAFLLAVGGAFWLSPYRDSTWERFTDQVGRLKEDTAPVRVPVKALAEEAVASEPEPVAAAELKEPQPVQAQAEVPPQPEVQTRVQAKTQVQAQAAAPSEPKLRISGRTRVERGDTLSKLMINKYGFVDNELLQKMKSVNPGIKDVNKIFTGDTLAFPEAGKRIGRK